MNAPEIGIFLEQFSSRLPSDEEARQLAAVSDTQYMMTLASRLRDAGHGRIISYSPKVFLPLTHLCRDVCHYCTFATTPRHLEQVYMPLEQVVENCRQGAALGCREALFTLGEKPELRYRAARKALEDLGCETTLEYVERAAAAVLAETGMLPHINAGCMTAQEIARLRKVSASMGIMLESVSERLCEKGMPHYGSPDKDPAVRLETLKLAGEANVPFTTGILIGIGETRLERIDSLLAIRELHLRYGHIQELIIQNFRAKPDTLMAAAPEPDLEELLWTIAVARIIFGAEMSVQAPPNLSPGVLPQLIEAGLNDWGGVSPLTPDFVNPEAPWPEVKLLGDETRRADKDLRARLTVYPEYIQEADRWLDPEVYPKVRETMDIDGYARGDHWYAGEPTPPPQVDVAWVENGPEEQTVSADVVAITERAWSGEALSSAEIERLFSSYGADFAHVCATADAMRSERVGDTVSYVVNRNINYTNVCYFKCQFCAFSKGKLSENLRGRPYDLDAEEISRRCLEAWDRGGTEVCMQGGIHPDYTGDTYLRILETVKASTPDIHVHAFSPLEVWQGAETLGIDLRSYLERLQSAGLGTLPGTAAEILSDQVRAVICPDKINTGQWLEVVRTAHEVGLRTTATIMYGHVEDTRHWAEHLLRIRELQVETGGITEFVPLPFVALEAPLYLKGKARRGPTFREAVLMHAVARITFYRLIDNIQTSWVKMGEEGIAACLRAGANDLGGTLMNETITRAAGASHGQEWSPQRLRESIDALGRKPRQRDTLYRDVSPERALAAADAADLAEVVNTPATRFERRRKSSELVRNSLESNDPVIARSS